MHSKPFLALLGLACAAMAQDYVRASDFKNEEVNKIGRAKKNNVLEAVYSPGMYNNFIHGTVSYNRIVGDGAGEVVLPVSFTTVTAPDQDSTVTKQRFTAGGGGLKYRSFANLIEEGLFYGGGIKVYQWQWKYTKRKPLGDGYVDQSQYFQTFIPLAELGFIKPASNGLSFIVSGEGGFIFSTFDRLEVGSAKNTYSKAGILNNIFYTANAGLRLAF